MKKTVPALIISAILLISGRVKAAEHPVLTVALVSTSEDPKLWNKKPDFMKLQRGKKSFTVNMQTAKGRELVRGLAKIRRAGRELWLGHSGKMGTGLVGFERNQSTNHFDPRQRDGLHWTSRR
jgi:hypothetical protein